jgi:hypothetical protein
MPEVMEPLSHSACESIFAAFKGTTLEMVQCQTGTRATISGSVTPSPSGRSGQWVSGSVDIVEGSFLGTLAFYFPVNTYLKLMSATLGIPLEEMSSDLADGAAEFLLQPANRLDTLMQHLVAGMAHVDAKHIDAGLKQALHHGAVLRGGSEGRQNLDATQPSHE